MTHQYNAFSWIATLALGLAAGTGTPTHASDYRQIDELASEIVRCSSKLVQEVHHYRHTPEYEHLRNDTREMRRLARHIRTLTRRWGNIDPIETDVAELDQRFHHLEFMFDRIERQAVYGYRRVFGNTAHVKGLLDTIGNKIHHLQRDIRVLRRTTCRRAHFSGQPYGNRYLGYGRTTGWDRRYDAGGHYRNVGRGGVAVDSRGISVAKGNVGFRIDF